MRREGYRRWLLSGGGHQILVLVPGLPEESRWKGPRLDEEEGSKSSIVMREARNVFARRLNKENESWPIQEGPLPGAVSRWWCGEAAAQRHKLATHCRLRTVFTFRNL